MVLPVRIGVAPGPYTATHKRGFSQPEIKARSMREAPVLHDGSANAVDADNDKGVPYRRTVEGLIAH